MTTETPIRILFVCTGNICRSPTAEGVFRHVAQRAGLEHRFHLDSAGTHGYHIGDPPDPRAIAAALDRGYDLAALRARQLVAKDFAAFDLLLARDRLMRRMAPRPRRRRRDARCQTRPSSASTSTTTSTVPRAPLGP